MIPFGLLLPLLAWAAFLMTAVGLFFWAARWFPGRRWLAPTLALLFLLLGVFARQSKWAVVLIVVVLIVASGFIPRKR
jgi:hypothetical protein